MNTVNAFDAARKAGWIYVGYDTWYTTNFFAVYENVWPIRYRGTARDVCLAHGIDFEG
jgi:hypothetical protein